jgi:hypothetical protein
VVFVCVIFGCSSFLEFGNEVKRYFLKFKKELPYMDGVYVAPGKQSSPDPSGQLVGFLVLVSTIRTLSTII